MLELYFTSLVNTYKKLNFFLLQRYYLAQVETKSLNKYDLKSIILIDNVLISNSSLENHCLITLWVELNRRPK